ALDRRRARVGPVWRGDTGERELLQREVDAELLQRRGQQLVLLPERETGTRVRGAAVLVDLRLDLTDARAAPERVPVVEEVAGDAAEPLQLLRRHLRRRLACGLGVRDDAGIARDGQRTSGCAERRL